VFKEFMERAKAAIAAFTSRVEESKETHDEQDMGSLRELIDSRDGNSQLAQMYGMVSDPVVPERDPVQDVPNTQEELNNLDTPPEIVSEAVGEPDPPMSLVDETALVLDAPEVMAGHEGAASFDTSPVPEPVQPVQDIIRRDEQAFASAMNPRVRAIEPRSPAISPSVRPESRTSTTTSSVRPENSPPVAPAPQVASESSVSLPSPPEPRLEAEQAVLPQPAPPGEASQAEPSPVPANQPTEVEINSAITNASNEMEIPATNNVRVPPELAGQAMPPPPPGLNLVDQAAPPQMPQSQLGEAESSSKPMTEQQGEKIIQLLESQNGALETISDGQDEIVSAIAQLAEALSTYGGIGP